MCKNIRSPLFFMTLVHLMRYSSPRAACGTGGGIHLSVPTHIPDQKCRGFRRVTRHILQPGRTCVQPCIRNSKEDGAGLHEAGDAFVH